MLWNEIKIKLAAIGSAGHIFTLKIQVTAIKSINSFILCSNWFGLNVALLVAWRWITIKW